MGEKSMWLWVLQWVFRHNTKSMIHRQKKKKIMSWGKIKNNSYVKNTIKGTQASLPLGEDISKNLYVKEILSKIHKKALHCNNRKTIQLKVIKSYQ